MATARQIAEAASMRFKGDSFDAIAQHFGVNASSVFRWQKTKTWQDTIADLDEIQRVETAKQFSDYLRQNLSHFQKLSTVGLKTSIKAIIKTEQLLDSLDVSDFPEPKDRLNALSTISRTFSALSGCSFEMLSNSAGLDEITNELERINEILKSK